MAAIWVTGSADGIGREVARRLVARGHRVSLHARDDNRAVQARAGVPGATGVLVGDLASLAQVRRLATEAGAFDAVVHNAAYLGRGRERPASEDGLELTFAVNVLAPYLLTALMPRPDRLVYFSSQVHTGGSTDLDDLEWRRRPYRGGQAYDDSKLYVTALAFAIARRWPGVDSNAVDPGWVRTRMGGASAPTSVEEGAADAVRLAAGDEEGTERYLSRRGSARAAVHDLAFQEAVIGACAERTGVVLPAT